MLFVAVGTIVRIALGPILGVRFPFATIFFAVLVTAWVGGFGPALLASALGIAASVLWLLEPRGAVYADSQVQFGLMLYGVVSVGIAVLGGAMHRARSGAERHAADQRAQSEQLRVTLESIGDAVVVTDAKGIITTFNDVASELSGWRRDEAIGRRIDEVLRLVDENGRAPVRNPVAAVLADGKTVGLANHTVLVARDGSERLIDDCAAPIVSAEGVLVGVVMVFRDVTVGRRDRERIRRSEQELSELFENANVGLHMVDAGGMILRANRYELDMLGYEPHEYVGHSIADFHVDREVATDIMRRLRDGEDFVGFEARLRCKDGSIREVLINTSTRWENHRFIHSHCFTLDVTRHRRAEEAQTLLAAVVQTSEDAIVTKTLNGVITSWNAGAERLFGFTAEEVIGRSITIIYPEERLTEEESILQRMRNGERVEHFETQRLTKDRRVLDISLAISPLRDGGGRIVGASMVARDITARIHTERALRESEARFRSLVSNAPAAIFVKDMDGRYTLANPLARIALGGGEEVVGKTDHDLLPDEVADTLRKRDLEIMQGLTAVEAEAHVYRHGFDRRYLSVKFPLFGEEGALGVCGVAIDITDRKAAEQALRESEERFRAMADNIAQFAWMTDENGWIFWYNKRWFDYTGTNLEEMVGWGWTAMLHPDHADRVIEKFAACLRSGEVWEDTFPLRSRDGEYRWFLSRAIPIHDEMGRVSRWFGTNTDITAQREAEEALRIADRRKDTFLATLAHELRNPLAPLRNSIEIMKHGGDDNGLVPRAMATMDRQLTHLERLVDDLLDIARISRDQIELRREVLDLRGVVEQAVESSRPIADRAGIHLSFRNAAEPVYVDGDAVRLAQVFANLLNNACKYTDEGGDVSIELGAEGDAAVVKVRDTGLGISPEMLGRVFDMFTQLEPASQRVQSGLGIGLTLVRRLVEMHRGVVEAYSEGSGKGSEFVVRLPRYDTIPAPAPEPADTAERATRNGSRRILVVDDNADAAEALSLLLQLKGHETHIARDGAEAFAAAGEFMPDIALLDIGLPVMSGLEVAKRIREQPWGKSITLVALTGWGQDEDRRKSSEVGFDHHLVKPIDVPTLVRILEASPPAR